MALIVFKPDCEFPRWTAAVFLPQNIFMLVLFLEFYIKTYIKKPNAVAAKEKISNSHKGDDIIENTSKNFYINSMNNNVKIDAQLNGNGKVKTH